MISNPKTLNLATSAMAIALCSGSLIMFRGPLSLMSGICIPIILSIFLMKHDDVEYLISLVSFFIITSIFFTTQLIFVVIYMLMAIFLKRLVLNKEVKVKSGLSIISFLGYLLASAFALYVGIRLTESILVISLHKMMLKISNNNAFIYFSILLTEALIICSSHYIVTRSLKKRFKNVV